LEKQRFTGVFRAKTRQKVVSQGGGTIQDFVCLLWTMIAIGTFLSQYFKKQIRFFIKIPFINSRVQISRLEIWVTNKQTQVNTNSNNLKICALQDLGKLSGIADNRKVVWILLQESLQSSLDTPSR
jgi:cell surface protein SprA